MKLLTNFVLAACVLGSFSALGANRKSTHPAPAPSPSPSAAPVDANHAYGMMAADVSFDGIRLSGLVDGRGKPLTGKIVRALYESGRPCFIGTQGQRMGFHKILAVATAHIDDKGEANIPAVTISNVRNRAVNFVEFKVLDSADVPIPARPLMDPAQAQSYVPKLEGATWGFDDKAQTQILKEGYILEKPFRQLPRAEPFEKDKAAVALPFSQMTSEQRY